jgi:hypothetical protein
MSPFPRRVHGAVTDSETLDNTTETWYFNMLVQLNQLKGGLMAVSKEKDLLRRSVGFMESLNRVLAEGFFESFAVDMSSAYEGHLSITIRATGIIPDSKKDFRPGVKPYLDAAQVIQAIRTQLNEGELKLQYQTCTVETKDWVIWNEAGTEVIGKLGLQISLELTLNGNKKSKRK